MGCSRPAVISIYGKCINDGETSNTRHSVLCPYVMKEKGRHRLSRLVNQNRQKAKAITMQVQ